MIEGVSPSAILVKVAILKRARILSKIEGEQSQKVFGSTISFERGSHFPSPSWRGHYGVLTSHDSFIVGAHKYVCLAPDSGRALIGARISRRQERMERRAPWPLSGGIEFAVKRGASAPGLAGSSPHSAPPATYEVYLQSNHTRPRLHTSPQRQARILNFSLDPEPQSGRRGNYCII